MRAAPDSRTTQHPPLAASASSRTCPAYRTTTNSRLSSPLVPLIPALCLQAAPAEPSPPAPSPPAEPKVEKPAPTEPKEEPPVPAAYASKKRPAEEAEEQPAAKAAKVAAPAAPGQRRPRKNQNHPGAVAARKAARKGQAEATVLFPVGQSPADIFYPQRSRSETPRHARNSRGAWARLKQVHARLGAALLLRHGAVSPVCRAKPPTNSRAACPSYYSAPTLPAPTLRPLPCQAAHGTLPLGVKRSKSVFWSGAVEEAAAASSSEDDEEEEEERWVGGMRC